MPNLSRRHLVTTAAALPALAVPAFASIVSDQPRTLTAEEFGDLYASLDDGDKREISARIRANAELLQLGAELEAVIVEWHTQRLIDAKQSAAIDAALEAAGLSDVDHRSLPDDEFRAYLAKRDAVTLPIYRADGDVNEDGKEVDVWDDIHDRMNLLIDDIMAHKPRTLAGLAVMARAFTLHHAEQWEPDADDDLHHRAFMEAVCGFAGVVPVPLDAKAVQS
jgi:hypothetical protein